MSEIITSESSSLENALTMLDNLSLESTGMHKKIITAQINTLKIVQNPILLESSVDAILDNLHQAIDLAITDDEKKMAKQESCLILQSILFYFHAKLLSEKESTRQKGLELLRVSDQQIMDAIKITAVAVLASNGLSINNPVNFLPDAFKEKISTITSTEISMESVKSNLLGAVEFLKKPENLNNSVEKAKQSTFKMYTFFTEKSNNQKMQKDFYVMLDRVFEKLERNKNLIGNSIVLSELLLNHHKDLITHFTKGDKRKTQFSSIFSGLSVLVFGILFLIVYFFIFIIDYFAKTNYLDGIHWYYILFACLPAIYFYFKLQLKKRKLYSKYISISNSLRPNS